MSAQNDLVIVVKLDNASIKDFVSKVKGIKFNIPTKEINRFESSVNSLQKIMKTHSSTLNQLLSQFKTYNKKIPSTSNAQARIHSADTSLMEKMISQIMAQNKAIHQTNLQNTDIQAKHSLLILNQRAASQKQLDIMQEAAFKRNTKLDLLNITGEQTQKKIDAAADKDDKRQRAQILEQQIRQETAKNVAIRIERTKQLERINAEHNLKLQMQKKEFGVFVNGFESLFRKIPAGNLFAPMMAKKAMGTAARINDSFNYQKNRKQIQAARGTSAMPDLEAERNKAKEFGVGNLDKAKKDSGGAKGRFMATAGKVMNNPMAAMGIAGGVMGLAKIASMAFDMSPAFQQISKLLKFGIMLVLKPIGDFFAFLFRPILLLLLRKFIIPNYQKWMPVLIQLGTDIGKLVTDFLNFATGKWMEDLDWKKMLAMVFPVIGTAVYAFGELDKWLVQNAIEWTEIIPVFIWADLLGKGYEEFKKFMKNLNIEEKIITTWNNLIAWFKGLNIGEDIIKAWKSVTDWFSGLKIGEDITTAWKSLTDWFKGLKIGEGIITAWKSVTDWFSGLSITDAVKNGLKSVLNFFIGLNLGTGITDFATKLKDAFALIITNMGTELKNIPKKIGNLFIGIINSVTKVLRDIDLFGWKPFSFIKEIKEMANGGIINEPVLGQGQISGKGYLLGERGAERVTPMNGNKDNKNPQPIVITININKMNGDQKDLLELRRTILEVMQSVNINRGR